MTTFSMYKKNIFLTLLLAGVAAGASALAYTNPTAPFPVNTEPPIDIGATIQAKSGGLSVNEFQGRGNAHLQQNAVFLGTIQSGGPGSSPTTVIVDTNTDVMGEVWAADFLNSSTLQHSETQPKPLCGDATGEIIFC